MPPPAAWLFSKQALRTVAGMLALMAVVAVCWFVGSRKQELSVELAKAPDDDEFAAPIVANPGYLGPQACVDCHATRVAEFHETRHFLATCVPRPEIMPQGFDTDRGDYRIPESSVHFRMSHSEGRFRQTAIQEATVPATASSADIAFIYGSAGGNDEVYFSWRDDKLYELPMVWLGPQQTWGASPFDRHGRGDFSRDMTIRCVECHNTWFEHAPGSRNQYGRDNPVLGVSCEVCHGPGRDHVAFHRAHPASKEPHAVVRPAQLPRERLMDLCAQCHSNALKHRGPAFSYRPGEPLDDHYVTLRTKHPEDDHVANQTTYLRQSRCFQQSETLTCVTCHNPHRPRSATNAGTESCKSCHQAEDCADRKNLPAAVQSDCIGCHMPEHRKIQVFFRTETDKYVAPVKRYEHQIGIYPLARQSVLRDWLLAQPDSESRDEADRISRQLAQAWRKEAENRQQDHRILASIDACRESLRFASDASMQQKLQELIGILSGIDADFQDARWHESEQRYAQAIAAYRSVVAAKPDHAMAHARLGTTYAVTGEQQLAREHLQRAVECDPDDPYAPAMLGWLDYLEGRPEQALQHYRRADAVEPYSAKINSQMGLALSKLGRWPEAVERLTKAITIDPNDAGAFLALSQALRHEGPSKDVLKYGLRAARLTHFQDPDVLMNLVDAYSAANRWDEAIQTAENALALIETRNPQRAAQIRIRLDELRNHRKR